MLQDLRQAPDHPSKVIDKWVKERIAPTYPVVATNVARQAAVTLREWEAEHGVVFATLDLDALVAVQEAYQRSEGAQYSDLAGEALVRLQEAVAGLLGLGDD